MALWDNGKPKPVSVVLDFGPPDPGAVRRANAYFLELQAAQDQHRGNRSELQHAWDEIWRKHNGSDHAAPIPKAPAGLWGTSAPAPAPSPSPWGAKPPANPPSPWGKPKW